MTVGRGNFVALALMQGARARRGILGLAAVATIALGAGQALGASEPITANPGVCSVDCTFSKPTFTIDQGTVATFQNPSTTLHNVTSSPGEPQFHSTTISAGQAPVEGTQFLAPGTYRFFCTVHPATMLADLVVTGTGTPVARPKVTLKILSSKLDKVVSSRRLKIKVSAVTASQGVSLTAKKGAKKLGSKGNINLAAGASRTIKLKLSTAARKALDGLKTAKVKVTAKVPNGSPASATRTLR
jgi:plastocyanin